MEIRKKRRWKSFNVQYPESVLNLLFVSDETFMRAALRQAEKGIGHTSPNPAVGAIIVAKGKVVARGWHRGAGLPHAEIEALKKTRAACARRDSLCHAGALLHVRALSPPCADASHHSRWHRPRACDRRWIDPNPFTHAGARGEDFEEGWDRGDDRCAGAGMRRVKQTV